MGKNWSYGLEIVLSGAKNILKWLITLGTVTISVQGQQKTATLIRSMIDEVSEERLSSHVMNLQIAGGYWSRVNFTPGNDSSVAYVRNVFESLSPSISVQLDTFFILEAANPYNSKPLFNVVATIPGKTDPSKEFIVGAHIDCSASLMGDSAWKGGWLTIRAPGADDNASGVAAMLELARVFSSSFLGFQNEYTIKFIAFGAEESGPAYPASLHGSAHYVAKARERADQILGMVNLDMLGYNHDVLYSDIEADSNSGWLAHAAREANDFYSIGLTIAQPPFTAGAGSDHSSFWASGFPAILLIENYPPWQSTSSFHANPHYHRSSDTLGNLNADLIRRFAQVGVGLIASLASPGSATHVEQRARENRGNFRLFQNFPNPFNANTFIQFETPDDGFVGVRILTIVGKEITTLLNTKLPKGIHTLTWESGNFPSGIYFCVIANGFKREVIKLVLVK
ncbi:MAG: M20/M25/M40 family metallo-hydrolase [Ignavibacteriales bacterium]|nr:M20/M25/M40 family metallo-hydrolase [Ignavibacteriales bacterium]